jgi:hypothetical protein
MSRLRARPLHGTVELLTKTQHSLRRSHSSRFRRWDRWLFVVTAAYAMTRALGSASRDGAAAWQALVFAVAALVLALMAGALWSRELLRGPLRRRS